MRTVASRSTSLYNDNRRWRPLLDDHLRRRLLNNHLRAPLLNDHLRASLLDAHLRPTLTVIGLGSKLWRWGLGVAAWARVGVHWRGWVHVRLKRLLTLTLTRGCPVSLFLLRILLLLAVVVWRRLVVGC